jgi:hypothetical protein
MLLKFRFIKFLKIVPTLGVVHLLYVRTPMCVVAVFLLHLLSFLYLRLLVLFSLIVCCCALCDRCMYHVREEERKKKYIVLH